MHFVMADIQGGEKRGGDGGVRRSTRFDELEMFRGVVQKNWGMLRKRGKNGQKRLMGSLGKSWSCNDLSSSGHLGFYAL